MRIEVDIKKLLEELKSSLSEAVLGIAGEGLDTVVHVRPPWAHDALAFLKAAGFNVLVDLTAVDRSKMPEPGPRFELTYRLMSLDMVQGLVNARLAVKLRVAEGEPVPRTVMDLWPVADWLEREVWDMFGIAFADRPGIKRLLMYEQFVGHPLRKDYPIARRQPLIGPPSGEPANNPSFNAAVPTVTVD